MIMRVPPYIGVSFSGSGSVWGLGSRARSEGFGLRARAAGIKAVEALDFIFGRLQVSRLEWSLKELWGMGNDLFPEGLRLPLPAKSLISGAFHPIIAWRRSATQAAFGSVIPMTMTSQTICPRYENKCSGCSKRQLLCGAGLGPAR